MLSPYRQRIQAVARTRDMLESGHTAQDLLDLLAQEEEQDELIPFNESETTEALEDEASTTNATNDSPEPTPEPKPKPKPKLSSVVSRGKWCPRCGVFARKWRKHVKRCHRPKRFVCNFWVLEKCSPSGGVFLDAISLKRHLLNRHFKFDNGEINWRISFGDKAHLLGTCECGFRTTAREWLDHHVLTDSSQRCQLSGDEHLQQETEFKIIRM